MRVGVNYPWFDYGWDFGLGPLTWRGARTTPRWYDVVDDHLRHFQRLGISVVRWFVLADGLTYGVDAEAPALDAAARRAWCFDPPPLSEVCLEHFDRLLERFALACADGRPPIQLLPVFVDFHFCATGTCAVRAPATPDPRVPAEGDGWVKGGRAMAVIDTDRRRRFLDQALEPLLAAGTRHREAIYAWEIINEPDWVTTGWHPNPLARTPVSEAAMRAFIAEGADRIRAAGFRPTVGFGSVRALRRSGALTDLSQLHHYPNGRTGLTGDIVTPGAPWILGEFATAERDVWPELPPERQRVLDRLRLARSEGCGLAIPWSFLGQDRHTSWSPDVERDIETFTSCRAVS